MNPALVMVWFICETGAQATSVAEMQRDAQVDLVPHVTTLPEGCRWLQSRAEVLRLIDYVHVSPDVVVWSARVRLIDGREKYSAGVVPLLTS